MPLFRGVENRQILYMKKWQKLACKIRISKLGKFIKLKLYLQENSTKNGGMKKKARPFYYQVLHFNSLSYLICSQDCVVGGKNLPNLSISESIIGSHLPQNKVLDFFYEKRLKRFTSVKTLQILGLFKMCKFNFGYQNFLSNNVTTLSLF